MLRLLRATIAALFSGFLPPGAHPREPRPQTATRHGSAEAPAADQAGGPGVLGRAAPRVVEMVGCGRHREAGDSDRLAPRGLRALLEVALEDGKAAWAAGRWPAGPRPGSEDGERERVGCSTDPRRVGEARGQGLRAHCVALHAAASP